MPFPRTNLVLKRPLFYAAILLAAAIFIYDRLAPKPIPVPLPEGKFFLGGVIVSEIEIKELYGQERASFTLEARRFWVGSESLVSKEKFKVYLDAPPQMPAYGDEIVLEGTAALPDGQRNPGGFDQSAYLGDHGITRLFFAKKEARLKVLRQHRGNPIKEISLRARRYLLSAFDEYFEAEQANFLKALFFGERTGIDEDFKDLFIKTGTLHILAVSGFNIGFLSVTLFFFFRSLRTPLYLTYWIVLAGIWMYCLIVGWQAPVVRASIMASLFVWSRLIGRDADLLNLLGASALVILTAAPRQIFDVGFQLSYAAVFAILVFVPYFFKRPALLPNEKLNFKEKVEFYFKELFWVSFVCLFATLPITVQNFYIFTPLSVLANMIVIPISFALFFIGFIFLLTFAWFPKIFFILPWAMASLMKIFMGALIFVDHLPGSYWIIGRLDPALWVLMTGGIVYGFTSRRFPGAGTRACVVFLLASNVFIFQSLFRQFDDKLRVTMLDVGQGDAIFLEFPHGKNMLVDAGKGAESDKGRYVIAPFLKSKGISRIDALVISHPQEDHIGGMISVLKEFKVKNVFHAGSDYSTDLFKRLKSAIKDEKAAVHIVREGDSIRDLSETEILVLNPPKGQESEDVNNDSLVLRVRYRGASFLLTGDIEKEAMRRLLIKGTDLKADVFKVPHHGAKFTAEGRHFAQAVDPVYSLISVGKRNPFGHPSALTLSILNQQPRNIVLRTDLHQAIQLVSDGRSISLIEKKS